MHLKHGFTLLELSIVLVIIGLIIGGITTGQDLIRAAERQSFISQIKEYAVMMNTFKLKYNAMPGDMNNATSYWSGTGNGGGNGLVDTSVEAGQVFHHLSKAEIFGASKSRALGGVINDSHVPVSKLSESALLVPSHLAKVLQDEGGSTTFSDSRFGNKLFFSTYPNNEEYEPIPDFYAESDSLTGDTGLEVLDMKAIDDKIDDGEAGSGTVLSLQCVTPNSDFSTLTSASSISYNLTTSTNCVVSLAVQ